MTKENFSFNDYRKISLDSQTPAIRLNTEASVYQYKEIPHKFLAVDLQGSNIMAGSELTYDQDDKRGWYLHEVQVSISLGAPEYVLRADSPGTTMGSSETTSSAQLSLDLTLGTFGDVPTTGASGGITIGDSYTENLTDFRVINTSDDATAAHTYRMAATKDGSRYDKPEDLVDDSTKGQLEGTPLFGVPEIAIANLPIISQAVYFTRDTKAPDVTLAISITAKLVYVEKTFEVFVTDIKTRTKTWREGFSYLIPASKIVPN